MPQDRGNLLFDDDLGVLLLQLRGQHPQGVPRGGAKIDGLARKIDTAEPAVRQKALHEGVHPAGRLADPAKAVLLARLQPGPGVLEDRLGESMHGAQRRAQIVRHAVRERLQVGRPFADPPIQVGVQALNLLPGPRFPRDIPGQGQDVLLTLKFDDFGVHERLQNLSGFRRHPGPQIPNIPVAKEPLHAAPALLGVGHHPDLKARLPEHLLAGVAEHPDEGVIDLDEPGLGQLLDDGRDRKGSEHGGELALAFPELLLGPVHPLDGPDEGESGPHEDRQRQEVRKSPREKGVPRLDEEPVRRQRAQDQGKEPGAETAVPRGQNDGGPEEDEGDGRGAPEGRERFAESAREGHDPHGRAVAEGRRALGGPGVHVQPPSPPAEPGGPPERRDFTPGSNNRDAAVIIRIRRRKTTALWKHGGEAGGTYASARSLKAGSFQ